MADHDPLIAPPLQVACTLPLMSPLAKFHDSISPSTLPSEIVKVYGPAFIVPVNVAHLGSMPGIVEDERVARGRFADEPFEPFPDPGRGRPLVGQKPDIRRPGESVLLAQRLRHQQRGERAAGPHRGRARASRRLLRRPAAAAARVCQVRSMDEHFAELFARYAELAPLAPEMERARPDFSAPQPALA